MIGFFEYQYLKFKKNHLRNLVALAKADGIVHEEEVKFLYKVGEKYGLKERQIKTIVESDKTFEPFIPNGHEQKVGMLYDIVGMMLADQKIEPSEMEFCENMFRKFNYKSDLIKRMIKLYKKEVKDNEEWEGFLEEAKFYMLTA